MSDRPIMVVWFSCGAASACAAYLAARDYGRDHDVRLVNTPIAEEDADNRRFADDVAAWVGLPLEIAVNRRLGHSSAVRVWEKERFIAGPKGAKCTGQLKKEARQQWERERGGFDKITWHVFGFTAEERARHDRFVLTERANVLPVLIDASMSKADCKRFVEAAGIALPRKYAEGYPNANCIGCGKANSPTYWNLVRRTDPEVFAQRAEISRRLNVRLVRVGRPGGVRERLFLDELHPDTEGGRLKGADCGIFCEENPKRVRK